MHAHNTNTYHTYCVSGIILNTSVIVTYLIFTVTTWGSYYWYPPLFFFPEVDIDILPFFFFLIRKLRLWELYSLEWDRTVVTNVIIQIQQRFLLHVSVWSVCFQPADDFTSLGDSQALDPSILWLYHRRGFTVNFTFLEREEKVKVEESINFQ